jgi:hypothetical protein
MLNTRSGKSGMSDNRLNRITRLAVEAEPGPVKNYLVANLCAAATAALIMLVWAVVLQMEAHAQPVDRSADPQVQHMAALDRSAPPSIP